MQLCSVGAEAGRCVDQSPPCGSHDGPARPAGGSLSICASAGELLIHMSCCCCCCCMPVLYCSRDGMSIGELSRIAEVSSTCAGSARDDAALPATMMCLMQVIGPSAVVQWLSQGLPHLKGGWQFQDARAFDAGSNPARRTLLAQVGTSPPPMSQRESHHDGGQAHARGCDRD